MEKWEEKEKKKEYLNGYLLSKRREKRKLEQIQQLRLDKMFPCLQYDDMPKGSTSSDLSDFIVKMEELMEELKKERLKSVERYTNIRKNILLVKEDDEQEVLERHYLLGQSWETIAEKMNYTTRNIHYIHGRALKNFVLPESFTVFHGGR